jgi:prepilin-type N-terminal cleavage/methylation domain-containing protein
MNTKHFIFKKVRKGLTLVEILVVLGLFSGIVTLALGVLFNVQVINAQLQKTQTILDNANLSLLAMTREIRYGAAFYCTNTATSTGPLVRRDCSQATGSGTFLYFRPSDAERDNDRVGYFVSGGILYKVELPEVGASSTYQMTSSEVSIDSMKFYVDGALSGGSPSKNEGGVAVDYEQPLVSIFITGKAKALTTKEVPVSFRLQTQVSPRMLDN